MEKSGTNKFKRTSSLCNSLLVILVIFAFRNNDSKEKLETNFHFLLLAEGARKSEKVWNNRNGFRFEVQNKHLTHKMACELAIDSAAICLVLTRLFK
jgi:hypothetical protein